MAVVVQAYQAIWPMCLGTLAFSAAVSALAYFVRLPRLDAAMSARGVFWTCLITWLLFFSVIMTLVDSPYLKISHEAIVWLFMTSAFLGIPMSIPLISGAVWAMCLGVRGERVRLGGLILLFLGTFMLGCVTSNMHDVLWCGIITDGYSKLYPAGGDLLPFYTLGRFYGIPTERISDYAMFGQFAVFLIIGEFMIAYASLRRLTKSASREQDAAPVIEATSEKQ